MLMFIQILANVLFNLLEFFDHVLIVLLILGVIWSSRTDMCFLGGRGCISLAFFNLCFYNVTKTCSLFHWFCV